MKTLKKIYLYFIIFTLSAPLSSKAQEGNVDPNKLGSPIKATSIQNFFLSIVSICIQIGTIIAGLAIIYGGFMYVTAQGDEEKISKAHRTLTWALVGTAVLLGAKVILTAIQSTVEALG